MIPLATDGQMTITMREACAGLQQLMPYDESGDVLSELSRKAGHLCGSRPPSPPLEVENLSKRTQGRIGQPELLSPIFMFATEHRFDMSQQVSRCLLR
jgi:hypothetical protein